MSQLRNRNILITGGASGIGRLTGERCLREGAKNLVIWDIDEEQMEQTAGQLRARGYRVHTYRVDITDTSAIEKAAGRVFEDVGLIDVLFNNAGIVVGKRFEEHSAKEIDRTMAVNASAMMHVTRVFLPGMIRQERGHIVNIASAAGYTPNPDMSVYVASKFAAIGWSESLRLELERDHKNLFVTTVTPGYIDTGMFDGVKPPLLMPLLEPDEIVEKIISAVKDNDILVQEPFMVKLTPALRGLLPTRVYDFLAGEVFKVYESMSSFVGHGQKKSPRS